MKHFSHAHGLVLKNADNGSHICCYCGEPISGPFYLCEEECRYYLHKVCAELPVDTNHPIHQNCNLLPATINCSDHDHHQDLFFPHASCATSSKSQPSRDENNVTDIEAKLLPMRKDWTSLISLIEGEEEIICEECELISDYKCCSTLPEQIPNSNKILDCEIRHFSHEHMLHLLDNDEVCGKVCDACAEPISDPSYGCTQCDYFLHKCCIGLPEQISHPFHSEHDIKLFAQYPSTLGMFVCRCCFKIGNTFGYKCVECRFVIDLKCASLSGRIKHEAHKHTLSANSVTQVKDGQCSTCSNPDERLGLKCEREACSLTLCLYCTMMPAIVNHRYCKCEGFKLRYSPLKDYHTDYYCDLCENTLQPKHWFYHCGDCDQFSHPACLVLNTGDSNIKFGKSYSLPEHHEHMLILTRFTYDYSNCKICVASLNKGIAVGFKCATCPYFKIHLLCCQ